MAAQNPFPKILRHDDGRSFSRAPVLREGVLAERPEPSEANAGQLWFDGTTLYTSDGSAWQQVASVSPDFTVGTTAGTVAAGDDARITGAAQKASNLSDLASASTARTNLGLGNVDNTSDASKPVSTAQAAADALKLAKASNLSDLASTSTARTNLGLGGAATLSVGTMAGTVAAGDDSRITGAAQKASNLSDVASASTARTNLGLGGAAVLSVGTTAGTVAAGDDSRITGAAQKASNLSDLASAQTARANLVVDPAGVVRLSDYGSTSTAGTALNAAIAALPSTGGKVVVPTGTWTIDTGVRITKSNVIIEGEGSASLLQFDGTSVTPAIAMGDTTGRPVFLRDFQILQTSASNAGVAVDGSHFQRGAIRNLYIGGTSGSTNAPVGGILFNSGGGSNGSYYNIVEHCRVQAAGSSSYGIKFQDTDNSNTVRDCRILGSNATTGVVVNSQAILLERVDVETGLLIGIDVQASGHACTIVGCYLEANATNLNLVSGVESVTVIGGQIIDATTANVADGGAKGLHILNSRINLFGSGSYDPLTYRTNNAGLPPRRWIESCLGGVGATSAAFGNVVGSAAVWSMVAVDVQETVYTDGMMYTVGTTSNGNVTGALYGPASADDSGASLALVASSASTAQSSASNTQILAWSAAKVLRPGRYYLALMNDGTTGTYMGYGTVTDVSGRTGYFTNSGGYTTPNDPSASGWVANGNRQPAFRLRVAPATAL